MNTAWWHRFSAPTGVVLADPLIERRLQLRHSREPLVRAPLVRAGEELCPHRLVPALHFPRAGRRVRCQQVRDPLSAQIRSKMSRASAETPDKRLPVEYRSLYRTFASIEGLVRGVQSVPGTCADSPVQYRRLALPVITISPRERRHEECPPGLPGGIVSVEPRSENSSAADGSRRRTVRAGELAPATAARSPKWPTPRRRMSSRAGRCARAKDAWGKASATERPEVLNAIADAVEKNRRCSRSRRAGERQAGPRDAGGRHSPGCRSLPVLRRRGPRRGGALDEIEKDLIAYHFREPLGVVGQIIPFNFPMLMAAWKLAPASRPATAR